MRKRGGGRIQSKTEFSENEEKKEKNTIFVTCQVICEKGKEKDQKICP